MRDRLVELIEEGHRKYLYYDQIADYLLANGVIVSPVKVGDTVWLIPKYNGKPYCGVVEDKVQMIGITSRGVHIKAGNHHDHNKMYMLGKSVFLSREDAEQALRKDDEK